jgi:LuxR family maltose regulon positive regulatory protein
VSDSEVRERIDRLHGVGRPAFDLVPVKLSRPFLRPDTVRRSLLIERLARRDSPSIVSVVAPAGYGKTTLLTQWAECDGRSFVWVSVDEHDNDAKVLLTYVAAALDAVEPVGERLFEALASPVSSVPGSIVPRLGSAFSSMTSPVVLVLDDVHLLNDVECRAAISVLADHVPAGSCLVLAGRAEPPLRVARLRAEGRILQIGLADLSLTREQAAALLSAAGVRAGDDEVAELHRRTEGWPAALYLAALYLREGGSLPCAAVAFGGDDRFVSEYVESEFLSRISLGQRTFLTRAAVLERLSGPLCDAVLDLPGSAATLAELARSNVLLVPLDRRGHWYRYHHLFRDMLRAELERSEPDVIPVLRRRAADWCLRHGMREEALDYAMAAEDVQMAARLVADLWSSIRHHRHATMQRWFRWLDDRGAMDSHPLLATLASMVAADTGQPVEAERWAEVVDRWQSVAAPSSRDPRADAWAAMLRAFLCRHGIEQMLTDADEAARKFSAQHIAMPGPALFRGIGRVLSGDPDGGRAAFDEVVRTAEATRSPAILGNALAELTLLDMTRGEWEHAAERAGCAAEVLRQAGIESAFVCAVQARVALHRGDIPAARQLLVNAQRLRHLLTYALPCMAAQARIELTRVHLVLGDVAGARTLLREVDELLRRRPGLGTLVAEAEALRAQLASERGPSLPGASSLTAAELRLLPLLSTHLSSPEIAGQLVLSTHTIRTQLRSIYRKLDASSRTQAIARARTLGLLDG